VSDSKARIELFYWALAYWAFDLAIGTKHQPVKLVSTAFTRILEERHNFTSQMTNLSKGKLSKVICKWDNTGG
jgi:hypothetical protein